MKYSYDFEGSENVISPALVYYRDIIKENIQKAIEMARGAEHLWPHVKTHKAAEMIRLSLQAGITRFKCATIAEAEMTASCGAEHIVLAYPLVGPNIARFLQLSAAYPEVHFYAIGDDRHTLELLGKAAVSANRTVDLLVDVNMGMNRTGVSISHLETFCEDCCRLPGISLRGLHCYDGSRTEQDYASRKKAVDAVSRELLPVIKNIQKMHPECSIFILGGTPSFPCHLDFPDAYYSPGTLFLNDYGYSRKFPDLHFTPGAAVLTRVVSCPQEGMFTLDLGYKGIAADPEGTRGLLLGLKNCEELFQSEEHWTYRMKPGHESETPKVGDIFFVIPTHVCPTSALYPSALVAEDGKIVDEWQITARNRKINY